MDKYNDESYEEALKIAKSLTRQAKIDQLVISELLKPQKQIDELVLKLTSNSGK